MACRLNVDPTAAILPNEDDVEQAVITLACLESA